jgi:GNAT superfamily N-acetyltransferase
MADNYILAESSGSSIDDELPDMTIVYQEVYSEPPYNSGPLFDVDSFVVRTRRQAGRDGFSLVTARQTDDYLVGFAFGFVFEQGRWWSGEPTPPPAEILTSRKFAVIELAVRQPFRGRGIGRALMDALLAGRSETYAVLTAFPDAPAREAYRRWGWTQTGTAHHTPESPILDALALKLS